MEIWDVYDRDGNATGKTVQRGNFCLKHGEYHLVVHIWIVGADGRLIIQRRSDSRPLMPGEWAATGGAAVSGEDSRTAAARELEEELGITAKPNELTLIKRVYRKNSFVDMYLLRRTVPISKIVLQSEEVSDVRKVYRKQLIQMVRQGKFHNYGKEYFDALLAALPNRGKRHFGRMQERI